jgi:hypothetical protein
MDVRWFKLPKLAADMGWCRGLLGSLAAGRILVVLDRGDHRPVGFVFPKRQYQQVKASGMEVMRRAIVALERASPNTPRRCASGNSLRFCRSNQAAARGGTNQVCG